MKIKLPKSTAFQSQAQHARRRIELPMGSQYFVPNADGNQSCIACWELPWASSTANVCLSKPGSASESALQSQAQHASRLWSRFQPREHWRTTVDTLRRIHVIACSVAHYQPQPAPKAVCVLVHEGNFPTRLPFQSQAQHARRRNEIHCVP